MERAHLRGRRWFTSDLTSTSGINKFTRPASHLETYLLNYSKETLYKSNLFQSSENHFDDSLIFMVFMLHFKFNNYSRSYNNIS